MPELRWILLLAGVAVIALVYFLGRRNSQGTDSGTATPARMAPKIGAQQPTMSDSQQVRREPHLSEPSLGEASTTPDAMADDDAPTAPAAAPRKKPAVDRPPHEQKIVTLRVAARGAERLAGPQIVEALQREGLQHGEFSIFHRHMDGDATEAPVFSIASLVKPGHFDLDNLEEMTTPGLSVFMLLPGPRDGLDAFGDMLTTARSLATNLDADVLDELGSTLSRQAESHIREEIINYQHRIVTLRKG